MNKFAIQWINTYSTRGNIILVMQFQALW